MTMCIEDATVGAEGLGAEAAAMGWGDPFGGGGEGDRRIDLSRTSLLRVAMAAARTGARFERDGDGLGAMAWLIAPREAFAGRPALEACVDELGLRRCLTLHACGTTFGYDADPHLLDELSSDDDDDGYDADGEEGPDGACGADRPEVREQPGLSMGGGGGRPPRRSALGDRTFPLDRLNTGLTPALFSCSFVRYGNGNRTAVFVAGIAFDQRDFARRVFERYGAMASMNGVRRGFDLYDAVVVELVSEDIANWLAEMSVAPTHVSDGGLDVIVEKRMPA